MRAKTVAQLTISYNEVDHMFKRLLFISAACLSLNGCIAGVAAAGAVAAGGTVMYDHRSVSTMYTDRKLTTLPMAKWLKPQI